MVFWGHQQALGVCWRNSNGKYIKTSKYKTFKKGDNVFCTQLSRKTHFTLGIFVERVL